MESRVEIATWIAFVVEGAILTVGCIAWCGAMHLGILGAAIAAAVILFVAVSTTVCFIKIGCRNLRNLLGIGMGVIAIIFILWSMCINVGLLDPPTVRVAYDGYSSTEPGQEYRVGWSYLGSYTIGDAIEILEAEPEAYIVDDDGN